MVVQKNNKNVLNYRPANAGLEDLLDNSQEQIFLMCRLKILSNKYDNILWIVQDRFWIDQSKKVETHHQGKQIWIVRVLVQCPHYLLDTFYGISHLL